MKMLRATNISSLASKTRFGLKCYLSGKQIDKTPELLKEGLKLCEILEKGLEAADAELEKRVLVHHLEYLDVIKPLMEANFDLKELGTKTNRVLEILNLILSYARVPKEDIEYANSLLSEISDVYLKKAYSLLFLQ